ncbi:MAG: glutamate--tRNA ligase [Oscillospiraceae bacterium]|nr:glutamate--tRNA ligase [Oscillospiraceae bacterium]
MADLKWIEEQEAKIPVGGVRTRFAPSPTGYMHVGNLRTALYTWLIARHYGGTFILRIEDTDQGRLVEGAVDVIYKTLAECGLDHDEGPDVGGPVAPYVQTERKSFYKKYAEWLIERGHAYYCFCEKTESEEDSGEFGRGADPCRCLDCAEARRRAEAGEPYVIRQRIPDGGSTTFHDESYGDVTVENATLDDQVLIKRDGLPTYNFANVVDDHMMGITHVVRGSEYLSSAPKYNLLYEGFGWTVPKYVHCSPVMRDQHNKMSKRHGDPSYEDLIARGFLTDAVVNYVALLGWSPRGELAEQEIFTRDELVRAFDLAGISKSPAIFDIEKLKHFNSEYIRAMAPERFAAAAEPYIRQAVKNPALDAARIAAILQQRTEVLTEIPEKLDFFDALPDYDPALYVHKKSKTDLAGSMDTLKKLLPAFESLPAWEEAEILAVMTGMAEAEGVKNAKIMWPARIALAGKAVTPGGAVEIARILGRDESLRRIKIGIEKLERAV